MVSLARAAGYHDRQPFDHYDFAATSWVAESFRGQLKIPDNFTAIWNRPTRNRMLYHTPANVPPSSVVRVTGLPEVYMLKTTHPASHKGRHYRDVVGLHMAAGTAVVRRRRPIGPANNPGWAVNTLVLASFADVELRSVNESQDREIVNYGHSVLFMPRGTPLKRHDTVEVTTPETGVSTYFVLEPYVDSGLMSARITASPDERVDIVYKAKGVPVYNPGTGTNVPSEVSYNITAYVRYLGLEELKESEVYRSTIEVLVEEDFIGVVPKVNDVVVVGAQNYRVSEISRDPLLNEWHIRAKV